MLLPMFSASVSFMLSFFFCLLGFFFFCSHQLTTQQPCLPPSACMACMSVDSTKKKGQEKKTDSHRRTYLVRCQPTRPLACLCHHAQADHASMLKAHLPHAEKQKRTAHTLPSPKANPMDDLEHLSYSCMLAVHPCRSCTPLCKGQSSATSEGDHLLSPCNANMLLT